MLEQWRDVVGFEGLYQVSNMGRLRGAIRRQGTCGGIIRIKPQANGYCQAQLYNRKRKAAFIHRLVLEAFVGPAPVGCVACHFDGNPSNNRLDNLRWDTTSSNFDDARRHGTACIGERHGQSKLTEADVRYIRTSHKAQRQLAVELGVGQATIADARLGNTWGHVA